MTLPIRVEPPERKPAPAPILSSANIVLMNQMATDEIWVSSDEEDQDR